MIVSSRRGFLEFMRYLDGALEFDLVIYEPELVVPTVQV